MSIIVNNTDNQLNISINGVLDVYNVKTIKSVSRGVDASGNYYIAINFIANDKNNSLRINLSEVTSPAGWTNDVTGANAAIADLRNWLSEIVEVNVLSLPNEGQQTMANSISVTLASNQTGAARTPNFLRPTGISGTIAAGTFSMSFASVGTANATVGDITLKPGEALNFDAGAINNTLGAVAYSTTTAGAELIIITLT